MGDVVLRVRAGHERLSTSASQDSTARAQVRSTFQSLCYSCVSKQFFFILTVHLTSLPPMYILTSVQVFKSMQQKGFTKDPRQQNQGRYIYYISERMSPLAPLFHRFNLALIKKNVHSCLYVDPYYQKVFLAVVNNFLKLV